jgi:TrmH family RNA methyltransferase
MAVRIDVSAARSTFHHIVEQTAVFVLTCQPGSIPADLVPGVESRQSMHRTSPNVEWIASRQNARLKALRRHLADRMPDDSWIGIEGEHLVEEAARSGLPIDTLFLREDHRWLQTGLPVAASNVFAVQTEAFDSACSTQTPQGVAAILRQPRWTLDEVLHVEAPRLVILDGLQDPGNVGTIVRTAEAFNATGVLLVPPAASPWRQKVLRASAGSCFRLPMVVLRQPEELRLVQQNGIPLYGCAAHEGTPISQTVLGDRWAVVIGSEGSGISADVSRLCSSMVHIPCPGLVESLNAATAAAILLYEANRQRCIP